MRVPYVDLPAQHVALRTRLLEAVGRVLDHGQFILGPEVEEFERRFAALCGTRHAVGLNSGTDALVLALKALGVGPGDEVVTAPNSYVATASAIALVGARPVFADVGPDYNLDPERVAERLTPRTRALLPVHLTGRPARMEELRDLARQHGLRLIEDCAQAVRAERRGRRVGSWGDAGCFSLHPLKNLSACGDGGVLTTDDDGVAERVRRLRNLGLRDRNMCVEPSSNSRLDTVQAAMLLVKLETLEDTTRARRAHAAFYRDALAGVPEVRTPEEGADEFAVYHTFVIRARRRDELQAFLAGRGVGTAIHYPVPIHLQEAFLEIGGGPGAFPEAEAQAREILSLPVHPDLSAEQLDHVARSIRAFYAPTEE